MGGDKDPSEPPAAAAPAFPSLPPPPPPSVVPRVAIFICGPSAEAEHVAASLRGHGYLVVDVPLSMLVARVAVQRPRIVLVDADADGAYAAVLRMRELPDADAVDVLFLGRTTEPSADSMEDAGNFFARPVDVGDLIQRIETLTSEDVSFKPSAPPVVGAPMVPPGILPSPSMRLDRPSVPPPPSRSFHSQPPPSAGSMARRAAGGALSNELLDLLADAEERAKARGSSDSTAPTPEEEIEAVLPTDLLAALDEPLEEPEPVEEEERGRQTTSSGGRRATTGNEARAEAAPPREAVPAAEMSQPPTVPPPRRDSTPPGARDEPPATVSPASIFASTMSGESLGHVFGPTPTTDAGTQGTGTDGGTKTDDRQERARTSPGPSLSPTGIASMPPVTSPGASRPAPPTFFSSPQSGTPDPDASANDPQALAMTQTGAVAAFTQTGATAAFGQTAAQPTVAVAGQAGSFPAPSLTSAAPTPAEAVLGPGDALDVLARAIATRVSGSLSFEADGGLRRVVVREGDLITCASSLADESLLAFLEGRGDLPKEKAEGLAGRVPPFGRHAGAALVAHGILRQDQLWPILRAHAEWILGRSLRIAQGVFVREPEPPGRLKGEPSVFGGSTGAEVLVEVVRRVVPVDDATRRLGGAATTFAGGANEALLVECALDERETHIARSALGRRLDDLVSAHGSDTPALLFALSVMRVLEPVRALPLPVGVGADARGNDPLDEDAIVAKIEARLALVEEGDYFSILGVPRAATGYEIRRAFLELRRTFEPARLLTPSLSHLATEVSKITTVIEEAFDILRDDVRRERYRRAIEARPAGL